MKRFASVLMVMVLLISAMFMACSSSEEITAQEGDTVKVLYTGTLDDGSVFDSSELQGGDPYEFTIGGGGTQTPIPGFENAVIGMTLNQTITVHIPVDEAYGPHDEELVFTVDLSKFEEGFLPEVGDQLVGPNPSGQTVKVIVLNVSEAGVVVDSNHPLAGEDLNFEITLVEIVKPPTPTTTPTTTPTPTPTTTTTPTATPNSP